MKIFLIAIESVNGEKLIYPRIVPFAGAAIDESAADREVLRRNQAEENIPEGADKLVWIKIPVPQLN